MKNSEEPDLPTFLFM